MLDDLLGKTRLKERIAELETERDRLEEQLAAESDRRKEAVTDYQEARRRANELQDRIAQLEDRVERLQSGEPDVAVKHEAALTGDRLEAVLSRLESFETGPEGALSAFVSDGRDLPEAVRAAFGDRTALVARAAPCLALTDDEHLVGATLEVPLAPEPFVRWDDGFRIDREWVQPSGEYALALVRADLFAMGEYSGRERVAFHGFEGDLKSQHSKGGFSQARFERLREEQIDTHLDRCRAALAERTTDRLYLVGDHRIVTELADEADATATVDASGDPEAALASAARDFWTVRLRTF